MEKPDVDLIEGLSPAISIEQKTTGSNPRSTVGTVTEIYDYLRLLFANIGVPHCPNCGREITSQSVERIVDLVMTSPQDTRITVMAPIVRGRKGEFKKELQALAARGFTRARVDGQLRSLDEDMAPDRRRNQQHRDRHRPADRPQRHRAPARRLVDVALQLADDVVLIQSPNRATACIAEAGLSRLGLSVPRCRRGPSRSTRRMAPAGVPGLGATWDLTPPHRADESRSLEQGAIAPWSRGDAALVADAIRSIAAHWGIDAAVPFQKLPKKQRDLILYGPGAAARTADRDEAKGPRRGRGRKPAGAADPFGRDFEGVVPNLRRRFDEGSWAAQEELTRIAPHRLRRLPGRRWPESPATVKGRTIAEYVDSDCRGATASTPLELRDREAIMTRIREIRDRLRFLNDVGVGYHARRSRRRCRVQGQRIRRDVIGSNPPACSTLDEPSIGLHQRDPASCW